jgi:hypothetical protein
VIVKRNLSIFALGVIIGTSAWAGHPSSFEVVMQHYEPIRLALLADSTKGVADHGKAITVELEALRADFSHQRVGTSHETAMVVKEQLPDMISAAEALGTADSLESARSAFYKLSKPMVRWRKGVAEDGRPSVAYCPMHKKSWLQPGQKIGNPYGGMPGCGKIVSK